MIELDLQNGEKVSLTVNMNSLRTLSKDTDKKSYVRSYFDAMGGKGTGSTEEAFFRAADILYTGYLCRISLDGTPDDAMSQEEFEKNLPEDMTLCVLAASALVNPNQKKAFERHLESGQEEPEEEADQ